MIIEKDTVIMISSGEYSDYNAYGLCRVLKDINYDDVREEYASIYPEEVMSRFVFKEENFINFLKDKKLLEDVPYSEWYLGGYSTFSSMKFFDKGPGLFT